MATERAHIVDAVDRYFAGILAHDASGIPLTDDVRFLRPDREVFVGVGPVRAFLESLSWTAIRIETLIVEDDHVGVLFAYDRSNGSITGFDYFLFRDGSIAEIRPFLNPLVVTSTPAT
jgi:ketosteroid isomerase-like protein